MLLITNEFLSTKIIEMIKLIGTISINTFLVNVNEKVYRLTLNFFTTLAVNLFTSSEVLTFN